MRQWCLRVSAYAQRLLDGLDNVQWTESLKETQRNWIGRSEGAEVRFKVADSDIEGLHIEADSIDAFESTLHDVAAELVAANHVTDADLHKFTARDLIPAIVFVKPEPQAA